MVDVVLAPDARRAIAECPAPIKARLWKIVDRLRRWPDVSGTKPLTGNLAGLFRIRAGDYRLLFKVEDKKVIVLKVGHRDTFYE